MTETPTPTPAQGEDEQQQAEQATPEVDWKAKAREWERRAKENKAAADRLTEIEEAQKTEAQRLADRLAEAERRASEAELQALRASVAATKGVPAALLTGGTEEELNASADALIEFRGESSTARMPKPDPTQGRTGGAPLSSGDMFAAALQDLI